MRLNKFRTSFIVGNPQIVITEVNTHVGNSYEGRSIKQTEGKKNPETANREGTVNNTQLQ